MAKPKSGPTSSKDLTGCLNWYYKRRDSNPVIVLADELRGSIPLQATNFKLEIMSNMSYCRFQNTSMDLGDCVEALENHWDIDLSIDEIHGLENLLADSHRIVEMEDTINEIIDKAREDNAKWDNNKPLK